MIGPVTGRIDASNSMYSSANNWMNSAAALSRMTSFCGKKPNLSANCCSGEKRLRLNMLNDSLTYKAADLQEKSSKKVLDDNIKRTFSTFA